VELKRTEHIVDYYTKHSDQVTYPLEFIPHDGYYPLLSIPTLYKGKNNPYFHNIHNRRIDCRLNKLHLRSSGNTFVYRKGRSWAGPFINIHSGFFSVIASPQDFDYMPSALSGDRKYRMKGEIDVFCLAVVKLTKLPTISVTRENYRRYIHARKVMRTDIELKDVKILVNEEKLRTTLYTKTYYTSTIRRNILDQIAHLDKSTIMTIEDVSDEYLKSFVVSPNAVRTNSLVETLNFDREIKDSVFSNLNAEFV